MAENTIESSQYFRNERASQVLCGLYLADASADVYFLFESGGHAKQIPAHKNILAASSSVFHQMFYGELKETGNIKITDATADGFTEFLQFFYLSNVTLTHQHIADVINLANKYDLPKCMEVCVKFLKRTLTTKDMCWGLEIAILFNLSDLLSFCKVNIRFKTKSIFDLEAFKNCSPDALEFILSMNSLSCDEVAVFDACMDWAKNKCKQTNIDDSVMQNCKRQLGKCFYRIRFPAMSIEQFSKCVIGRTGLFENDEVASILTHIVSHHPLPMTTQFDRYGRELCVNRMFGSILNYKCKKISTKKTNNRVENPTHVVSFYSNESVSLTDVGMAKLVLADYKGALCMPLTASLEISMLKDWVKRDQLILSQAVLIRTNSPTHFELSKPIAIERFKSYEIKLPFQSNVDCSQFLVENWESQEAADIDGSIRVWFNTNANDIISELFFQRILLSD